jgi:hypothetical protein
MSLWTPDGERPVGRADADPAADPAGSGMADLSPEDRAQLEQVRQELLAAPASVVVANHAMGIYELAAIHLTAPEPKLSEAVLAIDGLQALVDGLTGRLGEAEPTLKEALGQLKAAYLEVAKDR